MRIGVRLFARQREIAGESHLDLEVSDGGNVEHAWQALVSIHPALASTKKYVRFARNGTYATLDEAPIAAMKSPASRSCPGATTARTGGSCAPL